MGMMSLDEPIFDNGQGVQVTTSLLRVRDKAYPIGSIKAVEVCRVPPSFKMVMVAIGGFLVSGALILDGLLVGPTGIAVLGVILAIAARHIAKGLFMYGYRLRLVTATGADDIMTAEEEDSLAKIKIEIETALAMRHLSKLPEAEMPALHMGQKPALA